MVFVDLAIISDPGIRAPQGCRRSRAVQFVFNQRVVLQPGFPEYFDRDNIGGSRQGEPISDVMTVLLRSFRGEELHQLPRPPPCLTGSFAGMARPAAPMVGTPVPAGVAGTGSGSCPCQIGTSLATAIAALQTRRCTVTSPALRFHISASSYSSRCFRRCRRSASLLRSMLNRPPPDLGLGRMTASAGVPSRHGATPPNRWTFAIIQSEAPALTTTEACRRQKNLP